MTVVKIERKKQHHCSKKKLYTQKIQENLRQLIVFNVSKVDGDTRNTKNQWYSCIFTTKQLDVVMKNL